MTRTTCGVIRGLGLPLALIVAGCASTKSREKTLLPFHVALVPIVSTQAPNQPGVEESEGLPIEIDVGLLCLELRRTLEDQSFARATLLEPYPGMAMTEEDWIARAEEAGADLLLRCELNHSTQVVHESNGLLWLNLLLFELALPSWFVNDRDYEGKADLRSFLYDLNRVEKMNPTLSSEQLILRVEAKEDRTSLDFWDRASLGHFFLTPLVPVTFLAQESDQAIESLESKISRSLMEQLVDSIARRSGELTRSAWADFFIPGPETFRVERLEGGVVRVSGMLLVEDAVREFLDEYTFVAGDAPFPFAFDPGRFTPDPSGMRGGTYYQYEIQQELEIEPSIDSLRLQVRETRVAATPRSWTFAIRTREES